MNVTRTTIRLPDDLMKEAKRVAAETDRTLTAVIEDALRADFARRSAVDREPVCLTTTGEEGVQPGVDLDDSAGLLELMESGGAG